MTNNDDKENSNKNNIKKFLFASPYKIDEQNNNK